MHNTEKHCKQQQVNFPARYSRDRSSWRGMLLRHQFQCPMIPNRWWGFITLHW